MTINIEETLQLFSEKAGESWFLRRQSDGQYAIVKGNEIYAVFDADELDEAENKLEELNSSMQEDLEHQPDLFDKTLGSFYLEGDEVKVEKAKDGSKNFIFSPKVGNYLDSQIMNPEDTMHIVALLADRYINSDDFSKVLQYANREDSLIFNTTENGPIKISMNDLFDYATYLTREERFKRVANESLSTYLKRAQKIFNESFKKD